MSESVSRTWQVLEAGVPAQKSWAALCRCSDLSEALPASKGERSQCLAKAWQSKNRNRDCLGRRFPKLHSKGSNSDNPTNRPCKAGFVSGSGHLPFSRLQQPVPSPAPAVNLTPVLWPELASPSEHAGGGNGGWTHVRVLGAARPPSPLPGASLLPPLSLEMLLPPSWSYCSQHSTGSWGLFSGRYLGLLGNEPSSLETSRPGTALFLPSRLRPSTATAGSGDWPLLSPDSEHSWVGARTWGSALLCTCT